MLTRFFEKSMVLAVHRNIVVILEFAPPDCATVLEQTWGSEESKRLSGIVSMWIRDDLRNSHINNCALDMTWCLEMNQKLECLWSLSKKV